MRLVILVVLYRCRPEASPTLRSLEEQLLPPARPVRLVVWNNGPEAVDGEHDPLLRRLVAKGLVVEFREDLRNLPLGKLYNRVIEATAFDRFVAFDHDSVLGIDYLARLFDGPPCEVMVPRIKAQGSYQGPRRHGRLVETEGAVEHHGFIAIGSGLCLSRELATRLRERAGSVFDERYALYGVDTSFFLRLQRCFEPAELRVLCLGEIEHSLSRMECEDPAITAFRAGERSYDMGLTLRHYPCRWIRRDTRRAVIDAFRGRGRHSLWRIAYGFVFGKHPRC